MALPTTNLYARYIAGTGVTKNGSNQVSQWNDQTANAFHATQSNGSYKPYDLTDPDGRPVMSFPPGYTPFMTLPAGLTLNTRAYSIWIVRRGMNAKTTTLLSSTVSSGGWAKVYKPDGGPGVLYNYSYGSAYPSIVNKSIHGIIGGSSSSAIHWNDSSESDPQASFDATYTGGEIARQANEQIEWWGGDIYEIVVYNAEQSAGDITATKQYLIDTYGLQVGFPTTQVVYYGDSITAGEANTDTSMQPSAFMSFEFPTWRHFNVAKGSASTSGATNSVATQVTDNASIYDDVAFDRQIAIVMSGRNDVNAESAATVYSRVVTVAQSLIAQGWDTYYCTAIDTAFATPRDRLAALNTLIRDDLATDAPGLAGVIDAGASALFDPSIGTYLTGPATNTTYYLADGIHLTDAGNEALYEIIAAGFRTTTGAGQPGGYRPLAGLFI